MKWKYCIRGENKFLSRECRNGTQENVLGSITENIGEKYSPMIKSMVYFRMAARFRSVGSRIFLRIRR